MLYIVYAVHPVLSPILITSVHNSVNQNLYRIRSVEKYCFFTNPTRPFCKITERRQYYFNDIEQTFY